MKNKVLISFYEFDITVREVIVSIAIIAIWLILGFSINEKIDNSIQQQNAKYSKAIKVTTTDEFQYGMETSVGNAFVYGNYVCVDPVSYEEVDGEYTYIEKTKKRYTRHTRTVTKTKTVNGKTKTYTETEVYYTWDTVDFDSKHCTKINFCDVEFDYNKIERPSQVYIDTQYSGPNVKYIYYGVPTKLTGTIYTNLSNGTISDDSIFLEDQDPVSAMETMKSSGKISVILFWFAWSILLAGLLYGWFYLDNNYLE